MHPTTILLRRLAFLGSLLAASASAQTAIFSENVGSPTSTTPVVSFTGWQNQGSLGFSGTADVRSTTPSTSRYVNASGDGNVYLAAGGSKSLSISGIDTTGFQAGSFKLTFGAYKSSTSSTFSELTLTHSTDGTLFTAIPIPAQPTGEGTSIWRSITLSGLALPMIGNLHLKWTNSATTGVAFRIDDISLTGTAIPEPSTYAAIAGLIALLGAELRRRHRRAGRTA